MKAMLNILNLICAFLLFVAVLRMPSFYYYVVRFLVFYGAFLTFVAIKRDHLIWSFAFLAIAVLFNPFLHFYTGREFFWTPIEIGSGMLFLKTFNAKGQQQEESSEV